MTDLRKYITKRFDINEKHLDLLQTVYKICPEALSLFENVSTEERTFIKESFGSTLGTRLFACGDLYDYWEKELTESQHTMVLSCMDPLIFGMFKALFGEDWKFDLYSGTSSEVLYVAFDSDSYLHKEWQQESIQVLRDWFIKEFDADPEDPYPRILDNFGPPDACDNIGSFALFHFGDSCDPILVEDMMSVIGCVSDDGEHWGQMILGDYNGAYEIECEDIPQNIIDALKKIPPKTTSIKEKVRRAMEWFSSEPMNAYTKNASLISRVMSEHYSEMQVIL